MLHACFKKVPEIFFHSGLYIISLNQGKHLPMANLEFLFT